MEKKVVAMVCRILPIFICVLMCACTSRATTHDVDEMMKHITWYGFGAFRIESPDAVIYIDPNIRTTPVSKPDADIILITHGHEDNHSEEAVQRLANDKTRIIMPSQMADLIKKVNPEYTMIEGMAPGDVKKVSGIGIEAVPAYNTGFGDAALVDHLISYGWLGYVLKFDKVTIYITGGTSLIPEMNDARCDILIGDFFLGSDDPTGLAEVARRTRASMVIPAYLYPAGAVFDEFEMLRGALPPDVRMTVLPVLK